MSGELWLWALCALLPALWLLSFLGTDTNLLLLWAAWLGRRPEQVLTRGMVVWVTGASSGIGEELAFQLSKLGVSLVLSARRVQELERVKRRCLENSNLKDKDILVLPLDLADRSSHDTAVKAVLQEFGRIDVLVNNGGIAHNSFAVDTNLEVFKMITEVNYLGTVSLTKCVLPHMMKRKQGKIVTTNSIVGIIPFPLCSAYVASKHALRGFFNTLHAELFNYPGITVSNIHPGPVHSNIFEKCFTSEVTKTLGNKVEHLSKMATSRCARLILIAMANDLKEVWMAKQPMLFMSYVWQYLPIQDWIFSRKIWKKVVESYTARYASLKATITPSSSVPSMEFSTIPSRGFIVKLKDAWFSLLFSGLAFPRSTQTAVDKDDSRAPRPHWTKGPTLAPLSEAKMGRRQCKSAYNIIKNKTTPESSPPPTPQSDYCNADKAEENDLKKSLMKMLEEAFEEKMKNINKEIGENTNKKLEEINKEIEEKKNKKLEEMNNEIEEKKNKKLEDMNNEIEQKKNKRVEEMNKEIEEKRNKKLQELDKEMDEKINKKLKEMNKEIEEKTNKKLEEINKVIEEKTNKKLDEINKEIEDKTNKKLEKINKEIDGKKPKNWKK
ncbi:hypothetical protein STEG23_027073 [Scotinomys teguina]